MLDSAAANHDLGDLFADHADDADHRDWLVQAFAAERAPVRVSLPAPVSVVPVGRTPRPVVRASFVWMLALSFGTLLATLL